MKKLLRLVCLLLALIVLPAQTPAKAMILGKPDPRTQGSARILAPKRTSRGQVELWEECDGKGYASWKKLDGNKLRFGAKLYNHSDNLTLKAVELYFYATDVWGERIYGNTTVYIIESKLKLAPGKKSYPDFIALPNRDRISTVSCGIKRLAYTNGTIVEYDNSDIEYQHWSID